MWLNLYHKSKVLGRHTILWWTPTVRVQALLWLCVSLINLLWYTDPSLLTLHTQINRINNMVLYTAGLSDKKHVWTTSKIVCWWNEANVLTDVQRDDNCSSGCKCLNSKRYEKLLKRREAGGGISVTKKLLDTRFLCSCWRIAECKTQATYRLDNRLVLVRTWWKEQSNRWKLVVQLLKPDLFNLPQFMPLTTDSQISFCWPQR